MIEIITATLAAGELKTFMMQGQYLELLDAQYPVDVFMMDRSGGQISTMRQAEASFFSRPGAFEVIQLQSAQAQTVRFFVGSGDAGTRRSAGVVSVVDGGKARTLANAAFSGRGYNGGAPGNLPQVQLWNPAGSGKNVIVSQVLVACSTANSFATLLGYNATSGALQGTVNSKKLGGPGSTAQLYNTNSAALGAGQISVMGSLSCGPAGSAFYKFTEPLIVPPGFGLCVAGTAGNDISGTFEFIEETV